MSSGSSTFSSICAASSYLVMLFNAALSSKAASHASHRSECVTALSATQLAHIRNDIVFLSVGVFGFDDVTVGIVPLQPVVVGGVVAAYAGEPGFDGLYWVTVINHEASHVAFEFVYVCHFGSFR